MKKRYLLLFTLIFLLQVTGVFAQREIWGTSYSSIYTHRHGHIYKTDANGDNLTLVHSFDSIHGRIPGSVIMGSNGKLYGLTQQGGPTNGGLLYEYDLEIDSLRVLTHFEPGGVALYTSPDREVGLVEVSPGVFWGQVRTQSAVPAPRGNIFSYNLQTNTLSSVVHVPHFIGGAWNEQQNNYLYGPMLKAADGYLYTTIARNSTCPGGSPDMGGIARINPANNTFSTLYLNPCNSSNGVKYQAGFIPHNGKLYSVAGGGQGVTFPGNMDGYGIIYSYDPVANVYTKEYEFQGGPMGEDPHYLIPASNGKWYGTTAKGGASYTVHGNTYPNGSGILFEYDPATKELTKKYEFRYGTTIRLQGRLWLEGTNGKLYGTTENGVFEYDPATDQVRAAGRDYISVPSPLLEICRKPAYKYYAVTSHTLCEGTPFSHDLRTLNSETIVWKKDNSVRTDQTGSVLSFDAITLADGGVWQAELTNECGTTYPPAIHITVNSAGGAVTSVITPGGAQDICPGTSLTLSGNNGGVWNTGETTPTISVSQPGIYQVTNTNSCGTTYSNIVTVDTIHIPRPVISIPNRSLCAGDSVWVSSNVTGVWNTGVTADSIRVPAIADIPYSLTSTNQCRTDVSNTLIIPSYYIYPAEPLPVMTPVGDVRLCSGQTVELSSNFPQNPSSNYTWTWLRIIGQNVNSLASSTPSYTVTQSGVYVLRQRTPCGKNFYSDTLRVTIDAAPPAVPVITASGPLSFCPSESVTLQSNNPNVVWSTGATTSSITVNTSGTYTATASNGCGQTTSASVVVNSSTSVPLTNVSWSGTYAPVCLSSASPIALGGGSPAGGLYSGNGVSGTTFDPTVAGVGNHTLTYTYTNGYGCSGTATKVIRVETDPVAPSLRYGINSQGFIGDNAEVCEGTQVLIHTFPPSPTGGVWSTGSTDPFIIVDQTGIYTYTENNACGTAPAVSFDLTVNPNPVISYTQTPNEVCTNMGVITLNSATPAGGTYAGSGVTVNSFDPVAAGTGVHTITYSYTDSKGCSSSATQSITVLSDTVYVIPLSATAFCEGGSVLLASTQNSNIQWSNGLTHTPIEVTESGTYTVSYTGPCGVLVSEPIEVTVWPAPEVEYVQSPDEVCASGSLIPLSVASPSGGTYTGTGVTGSNFNPAVAGQGLHTVTYSYTDGNGCTGSATQQIQVTQPTAPVITFVNDTLFSTPAHSYQWYFNGEIIPGATGSFYVPTEDGVYTVETTDLGGCNATSAAYNHQSIGITEQHTGIKVELFPNPTSGVFTLVSLSSPIKEVRIYNATGQLVYSLRDKPETTLMLRLQDNGMYLVHITTEQGTAIKRLVVSY